MTRHVTTYFQMLIVPDTVDENLDIVQTSVMVHIHVCDELGGDVQRVVIYRRPNGRKLGVRNAAVVCQ